MTIQTQGALLGLAQAAYEDKQRSDSEANSAKLQAEHDDLMEAKARFAPHFSTIFKKLLGVDFLIPLLENISINKVECGDYFLWFHIDPLTFFQIQVMRDSYGTNPDSQVIKGVRFRIGIMTPELHDLSPDEYGASFSSQPITKGWQIASELDNIKQDRALRLERLIAKQKNAPNGDSKNSLPLPYEYVCLSEMNEYVARGYVYAGIIQGFGGDSDYSQPKLLMEYNPSLADALTQRCES